MNKNIVERMIAGAIKNLKKDKYLTPVALIFLGEELRFACLLDLSSNQAKSYSSAFVKAKAQEAEADMVIYILEAWFKDLAPYDKDAEDKARKKGIANDPERKEAIIIVASSPAKEVVYQIPFTKSREEILIEERVDMNKLTTVESRFTDGLWTNKATLQ